MNSGENYNALNKQELQNMYDAVVGDRLPAVETLTDEYLFTLNKFSPSSQYFYKRKIARMIKLSGIKPGDHILEVGSTNAHITFVLVKMGYRVTAVDLSPRCIEYANHVKKVKNIANVDFFVADAEDLSQFPDNHFDAVISFSVLRYVPTPQKALNEIYRVTKPGRPAVVDFPNRYCPWFKIVKKMMRKKEHIHDHLFSPKQVKNMFARAGFGNIKATVFLYTYKEAPKVILYFSRFFGAVLENIPLINRTGAIIMARGVKQP
jgi:ubiquinone/menaquinone biosynthesis C-methylase UbiE